jgi:hypothetical protein
MTCERAESNPSMEDGTNPMFHWKCTLSRAGRQLMVPFSCGIGHATGQKRPERTSYDEDWNRTARGTPAALAASRKYGNGFSHGFGVTPTPPAASDVLDCLASDAAGYDNAESFEDWASEYGYDPDSRKGERIYNTVGTQAGKLRRFLGNVLYEELLYQVERL